MRLAFASVVALLVPAAAQAGWRMQELGKDLNVVYAVNVADMNRDGKPDVVAINNTQVMWFEAPSFTKHVVLDAVTGVTKKDSVCFAVHDIDGDGWPDIALGADWQPSNTQSGGSLQWLRRKDKKNHDAAWEVFPIADEPTLHRIRWGDVTGDGRPDLVVAPLQGRGTQKPDWEGAGARLLVFQPPKDPTRGPWPVEVADSTLHILHNLFVDKGAIYVASKEGAHVISRDKKGAWARTKIGEGSFGEIKAGAIGGVRHLAAIEPWHGTSAVVLRANVGDDKNALYTREIVDAGLTEGHAVGWGDFDGDGNDELVVGWRGKPFGLATYRRTAAGLWSKTVIDDGIAVEDAVVADLNGDRRPDIIAGGRSTKNLRVYWNDK